MTNYSQRAGHAKEKPPAAIPQQPAKSIQKKKKRKNPQATEEK